MDGKQSQQHRQHFNLSESAKQMLEELTARRYPGKQRRQSQLVEDLITEAFTKEHMSPDVAGSNRETLLAEGEQLSRQERDMMEDSDPWLTIKQRYTLQQIVTGVVTRIAPFGVFVRIEEGIEGLLHQSELPSVVDLKTLLNKQINVRIVSIDAERHRISFHMAAPFETLETSCPSCSRLVLPDWKHCVYCGTSLVKVCSACGAAQPMLRDARFCLECGKALE